jgi:hypothetical protein
MAKKKRKKATAKAAKTTKALAKKKSVQKKVAKKKVIRKKIAVAKNRRKLTTADKSKSVAKTADKTADKTTVAKTPAITAAGQKPAAPHRESLPHKIESAVAAVVDIFTDAERLHHKLEPDISNEPE